MRVSLSRALRFALIPGIVGALSIFSAAIAFAQDEVMVASNASLGAILTDAKGMTLYVWDRDEAGQANVTTSAPAVWPPFTVSAAPSGPSGLGTAMRTDGALQATFNGRPLYYFANDTAPGDANGQAAANLWWVVSAGSMDMMMEAPAVAMRDTSVGSILTDDKGMTLYTWDRDDPAASNISTTASANWPLYIVSGAPMAPVGVSGVIGAKARLDGSLQGTYNGWPLYYNVNDRAAGDTNGDGSGGIWHAVPLSMDMAMAPASVAVASNALGSILTTPEGMTLYTLSADMSGYSTCNDACTGPWPPLTSDGNAMAPDGLMGTLSAISRGDATFQVVHNGLPLYTFIRDTQAGQTNGQGITAFGGTWNVAMAAPPSATVAIGRQTRPDRPDRDALTDAAGMSLYTFDADRGTGVSMCYAADECTAYWPPMLLQGAPTGPPQVSGRLGTLQRTDGTLQLTYNDEPLYYYIVDRRPGDFTGQGVRDTWGGWFAVAVE